MTRCNRLCAAWLVMLAVVLAAPRLLSAQAQPSEARPEPRTLLEQFAAFDPDPCLQSEAGKPGVNHLEQAFFQSLADQVSRELNRPSAETPAARAAVILKGVEQVSAEVNHAWPKEARFSFAIIEDAPALAVTMTIRGRTRYVVYGAPRQSEVPPKPVWTQIDSGGAEDSYTLPLSLEVIPLHRGPAKNPRYLIQAVHAGCAGSYGIEYQVFDWNTAETHATALLRQGGSLGLGEVPDFPEIGELNTKGVRLTLPYCWFSPIDTWDNPSLCLVDTYDLSGDGLSFVSRRYNRPDLLPIAKALYYAGEHDFGALRGYCASDAIARRLLREATPEFDTMPPRVRRAGSGREFVTLVEASKVWYLVERRPGGWVIVDFRARRRPQS